MMRLDRKSCNRGFTLVELIVVIVLIALLSALVIPGLLAYIDDIKDNECINHARSAVTAAQSEFSRLYQSGKKIYSAADRQKWVERMEFEEGASLSVEFGDPNELYRRASYTIVEALYTEGIRSVYYDGTEYSIKEAGSKPPLSVSLFSDNEIYTDIMVTE